jgi:hypothetical protein
MTTIHQYLINMRCNEPRFDSFALSTIKKKNQLALGTGPIKTRNFFTLPSFSFYSRLYCLEKSKAKWHNVKLKTYILTAFAFINYSRLFFSHSEAMEITANSGPMTVDGKKHK